MSLANGPWRPEWFGGLVAAVVVVAVALSGMMFAALVSRCVRACVYGGPGACARAGSCAVLCCEAAGGETCRDLRRLHAAAALASTVACAPGHITPRFVHTAHRRKHEQLLMAILPKEMIDVSDRVLASCCVWWHSGHARGDGWCSARTHTAQGLLLRCVSRVVGCLRSTEVCGTSPQVDPPSLQPLASCPNT